ncbi:MAG: zf-HC2 domain-containing protein [Acidobacteriota bacterium]
MNCRECLNFIDDFVEGELDEQNAGRMNAHILSCSECAEQFEILNEEKSLYAHYLLEVEAPKNLWMRFQTKLEAEKDSHAAEKIGWFSEWTANAIGFLRLNPIFSGAAMLILIAVGFSLLKYTPENESAASKTESADTKLLMAKFDGVDEEKKVIFPPKIEDEKSDSVSPKISKVDKTNTTSIKNFTVLAKEKPIVAANRKADSENNKFTEEEQMQRLQAVNLEKETAKQIEKTELLLRAFRNARVDENGETFDVAYEKEQAKKLLEKNISLRQSAANFGTFRAEEMLSQIEPYLLDISNLEKNPSRNEVLDIQERMKNQHFIAGLQTY